MDAFFTMDVQRAAIQTMETLYIIATSKNIDTNWTGLQVDNLVAYWQDTLSQEVL